MKRTHFEIHRFQNGAFIGHATLREAEAKAAYMGRGNLLDDKGNRAPGIPVFELDAGEEPPQDGDGLYIKRVVTKIEATVVF